jgi:anti-sigma regulatory factor (Ser/Thr protein kinase)
MTFLAVGELVEDDDHSDGLDVDDQVGAEAKRELWSPGTPATVDHLARMRRILVDWVTAAGMNRDQVNAVALAAYEAMSNVVEHAYPDTPGTFDLHAMRHDNRLTVTVIDSGRWKPTSDSSTTLPALRGRGLTLMKGLSVEFALVRRARGTLVRMTWPLS